MVKFIEVTNSVSDKRMMINVAQIAAITPGSYVSHKDKTTGNKIMTPVDSGCTILTTALTEDSCGWSVKESYEDLWKAITAMQLRS